MNENWAKDANLDGRMPKPVTEEALQEAAETLFAAVRTSHDFAGAWAVMDVAYWLKGELGAPGGWPIRPPLLSYATCAHTCDGGEHHCPRRLDDDLTCPLHGKRTGSAVEKAQKERQDRCPK